MKFLSRFVLRNLDLKLVSLAIALLLWLATANEPLVEVGHHVPLLLRNVPAGMELSSELPTTVQVRVRGTSTALRQISLEDLTVSLDFSAFHAPGERSFTLSAGDPRLPAGARVVRIIPAQLSVRLEERAERGIPVMPRLAGISAPGYRIARYEIEPPKVVVVGPSSRVSLLEQAFTDPINLTGVLARAQFQTNVYLPDPLVRIKDQQQVRVTVYMERR